MVIFHSYVAVYQSVSSMKKPEDLEVLKSLTTSYNQNLPQPATPFAIAPISGNNSFPRSPLSSHSFLLPVLLAFWQDRSSGTVPAQRRPADEGHRKFVSACLVSTLNLSGKIQETMAYHGIKVEMPLSSLGFGQSSVGSVNFMHRS